MSEKNTPKPRMWDVMVGDLNQLGKNIGVQYKQAKEWISKTSTTVINEVFSTSEESGILRRYLIVITLGSAWAILANSTFPYNPEEVIAIEYPIKALFSPVMFNHLLLSGYIIWIGLQISAKFLDDVFEINNVDIGASYILQAALANRYERINIKDGKVTSDPDSTILKIGGPGLVKIHLDSAALFEDIQGGTKVVYPSKKYFVLDRFERLRKVVDIRDHVDSNVTIEARTKDGIVVKASGVKIKYHIYRGDQDPTLKTPYPFHKDAVRTLVYRENMTANLDSEVKKVATKKTKGRTYPESLQLPSGPFKTALKNIISTITLSEFLARVGGDNPNGPSTETSETFYTRDMITQMIYDTNDEKHRLSSGMELDWIDIGTWEFPEIGEKITNVHREAWNLSLENLKNRSPGVEKGIAEAASIKPISQLLEEIILTFTAEMNNPNKTEIVRKLLTVYRTRLSRVFESYKERGEVPPHGFVVVYKHVDDRFNWL